MKLSQLQHVFAALHAKEGLLDLVKVTLEEFLSDAQKEPQRSEVVEAIEGVEEALRVIEWVRHEQDKLETTIADH